MISNLYFFYFNLFLFLLDGWIEKNVFWWLERKDSCQIFKLSCSGDAQYMFNCSHYYEKTKKPFIMIEETSDDLSDVIIFLVNLK